jgi:hypothetical protein
MTLNQFDFFVIKLVVWLGIVVLIVCIVALTWRHHADRGISRRLARAVVFGLGGILLATLAVFGPEVMFLREEMFGGTGPERLAPLLRELEMEEQRKGASKPR